MTTNDSTRNTRAFVAPTVQTGPDTWEKQHRIRDVDRATTVGELLDWGRQHLKSGYMVVRIVDEETS